METTSGWHWIVILFVIAFWGIVLYVPISRYRREQQAHGTITPGFIGWLWVFAFGQWIGLLRLVGEVSRHYRDPETLALFRQFPVLGFADAIPNAITIGLSIIGLYLMLRRGRAFVTYVKVQFAWVLLTVPLNLAAVYLLLTGHYGVPHEEAYQGLATDIPQSLGTWLASLAALTVWLIYVLRSRRVALTFVR